MEKNREFINESTLIWSIHLLTNKVRIYNGEKTTSSIYVQYMFNIYSIFGKLYTKELNWTTFLYYPHIPTPTHEALNPD